MTIVDVGQHAERGKPVGGVADAVAARRRLVEDEGELLVEAVDRRERRLEGAKVGRRRPARNEAEVGRPDRGERAGAVDARRVDEHVIVGRVLQLLDHVVDLRGLDLGDLGTVGGAALGPVADGRLAIHLEDADRAARFLGGDGEVDAQGALPAPALLRDKGDGFHGSVLVSRIATLHACPGTV